MNIWLDKLVFAPKLLVDVTEIIGSSSGITENSGTRSCVNGISTRNVVNKVHWHLWRCQQVRTWVEIELRSGIANMRMSDIVTETNHGDQNDIIGQEERMVNIITMTILNLQMKN